MSQADPKNTFYIVNKRGTVHVVDRASAKDRLGQVGYRLATKEEIAEYIKRDGKQLAEKPIAKPWTPEPPELPELPESSDGETAVDAPVGEKVKNAVQASNKPKRPKVVGSEPAKAE